MLFNFVVILIALGTLFMLLSFYWESLMLSIVTLVIWMGLSIAVFEVEVPYTAITSSDTIVSGTHEINTLSMYSWFFVALALIMFFQIIHIAFSIHKRRESDMKFM
jgi:hypothetical protein